MTLTAPHPLADAQTRRRRMVPPLAVAGGLAAATLALHFRDPHDKGSWGLCPTAALGFSCPGCGGLRAVNDLTNGDLGAAASSNLLFVLSIPLLVLAFGVWTYGRWTGRPFRPSARAQRTGAIVVGVLLAVFTIARNTPAGAWLAP